MFGLAGLHAVGLSFRALIRPAPLFSKRIVSAALVLQWIALAGEGIPLASSALVVRASCHNSTLAAPRGPFGSKPPEYGAD